MANNDNDDTAQNKKNSKYNALPKNMNASVGLISAFNYDYEKDVEPYVEADALKTESGKSENLFGIGESVSASNLHIWII